MSFPQKTKKQLSTANTGGIKDQNMGDVNFMLRKQDLCLYDMGGLRSSEWVITLVVFLYSNFSRHFTRLRHTLKGVILCCFSLLCIADIGWIFSRMLHCFGLFFYSGQFKLKCTPCQGQFEFLGLPSAGYSDII